MTEWNNTKKRCFYMPNDIFNKSRETIAYNLSHAALKVLKCIWLKISKKYCVLYWRRKRSTCSKWALYCFPNWKERTFPLCIQDRLEKFATYGQMKNNTSETIPGSQALPISWRSPYTDCNVYVTILLLYIRLHYI